MEVPHTQILFLYVYVNMYIYVCMCMNVHVYYTGLGCKIYFLVGVMVKIIWKLLTNMKP